MPAELPDDILDITFIDQGIPFEDSKEGSSLFNRSEDVLLVL